MATLRNKTLFVTGGSRGIGKAIALRAARDGAIEEAGGRALPLIVDIRYEDQIRGAVEKGVETFGGIDVLVNNASAIFLAGV